MPFTIVTVSICIPLNSARGFLFLHTLSSVYCFRFLMMAILTNVRWYFIVILIFISLIFLGSKITARGVGSHEIKRHLLLGRKTIPNLDSIFKSRDMTWPTKICLVKAVVFPVVVYGCESWTIKKAQCQRTDAFELWCWKRLFESLLDCKEIKPVSPKGK